MNKRIWIMNHYATNSYFNKGGRHYWFAKNLIENGYKPTVFCSNVRHNPNDVITINKGKYYVDNANNIPFVFIKTSEYKGNGTKRVINMLDFYRNLFPTAQKYAIEHGKPDVIIASSVHPLTLVAGIKIAKKFNVPCICEVRDLWPESLVAYGFLKRNSIIAKSLYFAEKRTYEKADKIIFTMEGGKDYIIDKRWEKDIDTSKIYHINNGVDLETFNYSKENYVTIDKDLDDKKTFKVLYTGSIRKANNVGKIVDIAEVIKKKENKDIMFLIYGDGAEKQILEKYCIEKGIDNVLFKGRVEKNKIPYILSKGDLNIMHFEQSSLKKYGASLNKLFEYFASGKPTISDCEFGYDLINQYHCGLVIDNGSPEQLAEGIIRICRMSSEEYNELCNNSIRAAQDYNFKVLTDKLINVIEDI